VAGWFEAVGWEVRLQHFPEHFLHIDVLFCMLGDGVAAICTDVLGRKFVEDVTADYGIHTVVDVTYNEAMALGANGVALGGGKVLMAKQASGSRISEKLRAEGLDVTELDLGMFVLDGGGPHCLTMPLRRKSVGAGAGTVAEVARAGR
jgi:N-dimethylarginine dimethylaminohydrolase